MPRPSLRLTSVTIGTSQPHELADFYARLLGRPVTDEDPPEAGDPTRGGWAQIRQPEQGPTLNFEFEQCFSRPVWPSREGEQTATAHLDIHVDDLGAAVEWAVAQGATLAEFQPQEDVRVLFDPSGHPLCLFR